MTFTFVFLSLIITLIAVKTRTVILRNHLNASHEKRVLIASTLLVLFLVTNATLPYPESLYWFLGLGVIITSIALSYKVIKREFKRFMALSFKRKTINTLFYSLLIVVANIYL